LLAARYKNYGNKLPRQVLMILLAGLLLHPCPRPQGSKLAVDGNAFVLAQNPVESTR
jgi:hypothetical protein